MTDGERPTTRPENRAREAAARCPHRARQRETAGRVEVGLCQRGWAAAELPDHSGRLTTPPVRDPATSELHPAGWDKAGVYVPPRRTVASRNRTPAVAPPPHRQVYALRTGACAGASVPRHYVRCRDGLVEARLRREG
ncbi:hypothetical protein [Micromonospora rubida]